MKAEDIKRLRKQKGWTQQKLAEKLGVGLATVCRWETGVHKPSPMATRHLLRLVRSN